MMLPLFLDDKKIGLNKSEMRDLLVRIEFSQIKSHHASHTSMSFFFPESLLDTDERPVKK